MIIPGHDMTKIQLYRFFRSDDFSGHWWCWFDEKKDRITGKWRLEDGDVVIEVAHGDWYGIFKKKWIEEIEWYESDKVKFVQEFDCAT